MNNNRGTRKNDENQSMLRILNPKKWWVKKALRNAMNDAKASPVLFKRIGKAFKSTESREVVFSMPFVGLITAVGFLISKNHGGPFAEGTEWLFKTATELQIHFLFLVFILACWLLATHKPVNQQWFFPKRIFFMPLLRLTSDTASAAMSAFLVVGVWSWWTKAPLLIGSGASASIISMQDAFNNFGYFLLLSLFLTIVRLLTDSPISSVLFQPISKTDPNLQPTMRIVGTVAFIITAVAWLFAYGFFKV